MTRIDSSTLKEAYLRAGGTETDWEVNKPRLIEQARQQQAVNEALAEANRTPSISDTLRNAARQSATTGSKQVITFGGEGEAA